MWINPKIYSESDSKSRENQSNNHSNMVEKTCFWDQFWFHFSSILCSWRLLGLGSRLGCLFGSLWVTWKRLFGDFRPSRESRGSQNGAKMETKSVQKSMQKKTWFLIGFLNAFGGLWELFGDSGPSTMSVSLKRDAHFLKLRVFLLRLIFLDFSKF